MSAFPWGTLITAASTLAAAFGAVSLKGRYDARVRRADAAIAEAAAAEERRRHAYAEVVVTGRHVLRNLRQLKHSYVANEFNEETVKEITGRTGRLADQLNQTTTVGELLGSETARAQSARVYDAATAAARVYQERSIAIFEAGPRWQRVLPAFDGATADKACDLLAAEIDAFITAVRAEISSLSRTARASAAQITS